jgi:ABC-type lipoprotein export system ATPase subunit
VAVIEFTSVTVEYPGVKPLDSVNLHVGSGTTALMGPSGSGKSTLLRLIAGLQAPDSGRVTIGGSPVVRASWRTASDSRVSVIHQDYRLVSFLTVEANLLLAAELRRQQPSRGDLEKALQKVGIAPAMLPRMPSALSGGEQQRVAIARALLAKSDVVVADEPTGALDADNSDVVADLLAELGSADDLAVVVATHDPAVAAKMDRHLRISAGKVTEAT